jgi:ubiquinone/menaquinone biosynthesis C-methylase UbiE
VSDRADASVKQRVRDQFATAPADYVRSQTHASGPDLARMVELANPNPDDLLLDLATGGGHVARAFAPLVRRVVLADFTLPMLATALAHLSASGIDNRDGVAADAEALPVAAASIDIVTCRIAPHHFPRPERFVAEVARVLKPGGRFVLIDSTVPAGPLGAFFNSFEKLRDPSHVRSLTIGEWTGLITETDLTLASVESFRKRHDFDDWTARTRTAPAARTELMAMMRAAGPAAASAFEIEWDAGRLVSFSDVKTLFLATKPT